MRTREPACSEHTCPHMQVFYRTSGQDSVRVLSTNRTSAELRLPVEDGGYIIHVRATTDGGDGASSEPVRVPRITSKLTGHLRIRSSQSWPRGGVRASVHTTCPHYLPPTCLWGAKEVLGLSLIHI